MNMTTTTLEVLVVLRWNITRGYTMEVAAAKTISNRLLLWKLMKNHITKMSHQCVVEVNSNSSKTTEMLIVVLVSHLHHNKTKTQYLNRLTKIIWIIQSKLIEVVNSRIWVRITIVLRNRWHFRKWMLRWNRSRETKEDRCRIQEVLERIAMNHGKKTRE